MKIPRPTLRLKEKYILMVIIATFILFSVIAISFLPELKVGTQMAYESINKAGPELLGLIPPPMAAEHEQDADLKMLGGRPDGQIARPHHHPITARGRLTDMQRLSYMIHQEFNKNYSDQQSAAVLPKPVMPDILHKQQNENDDVSNNKLQSGEQNSEMESGRLNGSPESWPVKLPTGEPRDEETRERREFIKNMMKHGWSNYEKYAWGDNELRPVSLRGHSAGIFGDSKLGATIVDGLDTLYIMGMMEEYERGKRWIEEHLTLKGINSDMSVFETNIRFVCGLLTLYAFTGDKMYVDKAKEIADALLPAFETPYGIPKALVNPTTKASKNYAWASGSSSILSEIGSLHLEFVYLSDILGDPSYKDKVFKIRNYLDKMNKPNGLYPLYLNPRTGQWGAHHFSIGALGDSFYEYLLKAYLQSGGKDQDARRMYDESIQAMEKHLLQTSVQSNLHYFAEMKYDRLEQKFDHLACFAAGMIAMGGQSLEGKQKDHYVNLGAELAHTCHESYVRTPTRIGPESFRFTNEVEARAVRPNEKYYILRPEVIEGWFYMWRITHDQKYRDWAWDAAQAIEKYCRVEGGYSGIKNVYDVNSPKDDVTQTFFFAETLKYLYLIFSSDDLLPFEEWVFNTEAHPLPVKGKNPAYQKTVNGASII